MSELKKLSIEDIKKNENFIDALKELGETPEKYLERVEKSKKVKSGVRDSKDNKDKVKILYKSGVYINKKVYDLFIKRSIKRERDKDKFLEIVDEYGKKLFLSSSDCKFLDRKVK